MTLVKVWMQHKSFKIHSDCGGAITYKQNNAPAPIRSVLFTSSAVQNKVERLMWVSKCLSSRFASRLCFIRGFGVDRAMTTMTSLIDRGTIGHAVETVCGVTGYRVNQDIG